MHINRIFIKNMHISSSQRAYFRKKLQQICTFLNLKYPETMNILHQITMDMHILDIFLHFTYAGMHILVIFHEFMHIECPTAGCQSALTRLSY